jgi:GNAT superfamily N-acetyltransferase
MIEIKELDKNLLLDYINSTHFGEGNDIPITFHRALSQSSNPRLEESDIILLLAYENETMVGYLGILPDLAFFKDRGSAKIAWITSLWVSHHMRGMGIGIKLITKALELWNYNVLSADYVPFTKKLYDKTKLFIDKPYSMKGIRLYIKSDLETLLPPKSIFFAKLKWLLKAVDISANILLNMRLAFYKAEISKLNFEYIDHIDDEINEFIISKQENQLFKRKKEELNWIINNPWILSALQKDYLNKKYYFSSTDKSFHFHSLKVRNSNEKLIAFMIFTERDNTLKLPYLYHDNCIDSIIQVINYHLLKWGIKTFTTFNPELGHQLRNTKSPAILKKEVMRNYMVSSILRAEIFNYDIEIQDGDGDCAFT